MSKVKELNFKSKTGEIDKIIGENLRFIRGRLGLSQKNIAQKLGVSFQQIQKYEKGTNRLSAARLYNLAHALDISLYDFYSGLNNSYEQNTNSYKLDGETLKVLHIFNNIQNEELRASLIKILQNFITTDSVK